jgi:hypothetical protein
MSTLLQRGRVLQRLLFQVEQSFEDSLEAEDSLRARLEDGGARFHMWAVNLGLFDDGHASLDYRLQNAEDAREYVEGLLDDMKGYLEESKRPQIPLQNKLTVYSAQCLRS